MLNILSNMLRGTPLDVPARRVWRSLRASGLTSWKPLVPPSDFSDCVRNAITALRRTIPDDRFGDYLEFGVSRGTSLACVHDVLSQSALPQVRLIGFDSFEGLPPEAADEGWMPGQYRSTLAATRNYLARAGVDNSRVVLVPGWFDDTLTAETRERLQINKASLIMVDCDLYSASRTALWFCEPLIRDQSVILFDDWGWRSDKGQIGQKEAFDEFMAEFPDLTAEALPPYIPQARVFLVSRKTSAITRPGGIPRAGGLA